MARTSNIAGHSDIVLGLGQIILNVFIRCHDPRGCKPIVRQLMVPPREPTETVTENLPALLVRITLYCMSRVLYMCRIENFMDEL